MAEGEGRSIGELVARIGELLAPILYQPPPDHPVIRPYATMNRCGHVYLPGDGSYVENAAELVDLMNMDREMIQRILARSPHRAGEKAPGCANCSVERTVKRRMEPLHWRLN